MQSWQSGHLVLSALGLHTISVYRTPYCAVSRRVAPYAYAACTDPAAHPPAWHMPCSPSAVRAAYAILTRETTQPTQPSPQSLPNCHSLRAPSTGHHCCSVDQWQRRNENRRCIAAGARMPTTVAFVNGGACLACLVAIIVPSLTPPCAPPLSAPPLFQAVPWASLRTGQARRGVL